MRWTNCSPPRDQATFQTPHGKFDQKLASCLVDACRSGHAINSVHLKHSILDYRNLENIVEMTPEVCSIYGECTQHQVKGVAIIDPRLDYKAPYRRGNLRVRLPGRRSKYSPHLSFVGFGEIDQFLLFGTGTLCVIVVGEGGRIDDLMGRLARAIKAGRIESVLVVREEKTTQDEWQSTYDATRRLGVTVGYRDLSLEDLMR